MRKKIKRIDKGFGQLLVFLFLFLFPTIALGADALPQFFGLYLRIGEQIVELQASRVEQGGLFTLTRTAVSTSTPEIILYHDQHSPHDLQLTQLRYTFRVGEQGKWVAAESIPLKIAPVEEKPYMYRLVPGKPLSEGVYAIHFGSLLMGTVGLESQAYDFVVGDPTRGVDLQIHRTQAEVYAQNPETWDQAIAAYREALRIVPKDTTLQEKLALLYYQKQDYPAAIEAFQHLLALVPEKRDIQQKLLDAHIQLGRTALQEGKHPSALEHLSQALPLAEQVDQEKVAIIAGLQAEVYYEQQDFDRAFTAAQKAVKKEVPFAKPYVILAFLHARRGEQKEALAMLNQAARKGFEADVGGHLLVDTGYGNLTIPVQEVASVGVEELTLKSGEVFKGKVQLEIE